jgi:hypothetical protein
MKKTNLNAETQRRREKNLSPGPSPQERGAVPKGRILLFRKTVSEATAELPLSRGESLSRCIGRVGGRVFFLCALRVSAFKKSV